MATPEQIAAKAKEVEAAAETADKSGGAKHFDQPGVRFSIPELRTEELDRKTVTGESFRQHVEVALITLRALSDLNPTQFADFAKKIKFNATDAKWESKNKHTAEVLAKWLDDVQSGNSQGGGAAAAAVAREKALRGEVDELKKLVAQLKAGKATT